MRQSLFLLKELVQRDFRGRYAGSVLGFVWSFVQPLWLLVLYTFVFEHILRITPVGERSDSFGILLFAGLLPWMALHEGVLRGATAITDNAMLVKKLRFPSEILVLTVTLAALLHECVAGLVFVVVLAFVGELELGGIGLLLLAVPLQLLLTLGLGMLLATVNVFFRDTSQILGMVFNGWFFLTPIVYTLSWVPERWRPLVAANPLTSLVELYRQALLGGTFEIPPGTGILAACSIGLAALGMWVFHRMRPAFVDEI